MMEWQKTLHLKYLSLGDGLIVAKVQWSIQDKKQEAIINGKVIGLFQTIDQAKQACEDNIRLRLKKVMTEIS